MNKMKGLINIEPIIITSIPRSGSALIVGIMELCGVFGGEVNAMYENNGVKEINSRVLYMNGFDPEGQHPIPDPYRMESINPWKHVLENTMICQGYTGGAWYVHDPLLLLNWHNWFEAYPKAKWVIIRRNSNDVIHSCMKTGYMKAFNDLKKCQELGAVDKLQAWRMWEKKYYQHLLALYNTVPNVTTIFPEKMVYDDYREVEDLLDGLGLPWDSRIPEYMNLKLKKSRKKKGVIE